MLNRANPYREYRIFVRYDRKDPKWYKIYEGRWTQEAAQKYHGNTAAECRVQAILTPEEVEGVFEENFSLKLLDHYLDEHYVIAEGPPNRLADPDIMSAVRRRVFPFEAS